jgi:hypothetical protein
LERLEIPKNPEVFEKALIAIFGEQKAKKIDKLILAEIRNIFQIKRGSTLTLREAVRLVKNSCICKFA